MDFQEYLQELADASVGLKVSQLVRLSAMSRERAGEFARVWPRLAVKRRRQVVRELADLAEDNVELNFDAAFMSALTDADAEVRLDAVRGLWEYEGADLIGPLLRMMEADENPVVRAEAALALGRFVLLAHYGKLRDRYAERLEAALRRVVEKADEVEEVRGRALEAVAPLNGAWVRQAIREAYESGTQQQKVSAVHAMGRSCEGRWLPLLLRELASDDPEVRYEAAVACGSLGDERAVPPLATLLEETDSEVKGAAI
ncbi:MAG TPA: HEAT repeat domain-containing protein, partial [Dehalococcoidia bacterium]|nr:HEAT repeat domain-containing protein [Dehalococcoidia bacterium]